MSKPLILVLKEEIESLKREKEWKSQDVSLSYSGKTTIEDLKNAKEAILLFRISDSSFVTIHFLKEMSGLWLSTMAKSDSTTDARCSAKIDFSTGYIENGAQGYIDLAISKVFWR